MEKQGKQEDPRYSQLIAIRARQGNAEHPRPPMQVGRLIILEMFNQLNCLLWNGQHLLWIFYSHLVILVHQ